MVKKKRSSFRISAERNMAVERSLIYLIVGLIMALSGFVWATYVDDPLEVNGSSVGSTLLSTFGLIIAASALLIMAATIVSTQVKARKSRKK